MTWRGRAATNANAQLHSREKQEPRAATYLPNCRDAGTEKRSAHRLRKPAPDGLVLAHGTGLSPAGYWPTDKLFQSSRRRVSATRVTGTQAGENVQRHPVTLGSTNLQAARSNYRPALSREAGRRFARPRFGVI